MDQLTWGKIELVTVYSVRQTLAVNMDGGLRGPHYIISWQLRYLKGGAEGGEAEEGNMCLLLKMAFGEYSQVQKEI